MKRVAFSRRAADDLRDIKAWYESVAPDALSRVIADINRCMDLLSEHPRAGQASDDGRYRHIVSGRYRYRIVYRDEHHRVLILGIYRYQDRKL